MYLRLLLLLPLCSSFVLVPSNHHAKLSNGGTSLKGRSRCDDLFESLSVPAMSIALAMLFSSPSPALADGQTKTFKLPPIDNSDPARCSVKSSGIGQANAARDKLYDLRSCSLPSVKAQGYDLSGVIMSQTDISGGDFTDAQFSKGYLRDSNFKGATFKNGIVDRASFAGSDLRQADFTNAVLTGTSFDGADVTGADFTDAYIGDFDIRALCKNPTLTGTNEKSGAETRMTVGCK